MRSRALEKGFTLNEYSIRKLDSDTPLKVESEKDVFDYIDFKFLKPEERNMWRNIQLVAAIFRLCRLNFFSLLVETYTVIYLTM